MEVWPACSNRPGSWATRVFAPALVSRTAPISGERYVAPTLVEGIIEPTIRVLAHNWGKYDFGSGPQVADRLNQGPFPQYPPDAVIPSDDVVMTTTPSEDVVPNYGKGLVTYITADSGTEEIKSAIFPRPSKSWFAFLWASNFMSVRRGGKCSRAADAWRCPST